MGLRWDYGGETEGERRTCGITEGGPKCAILAHNPLLALNVNQQSLPYNAQSCSALIGTPFQLYDAVVARVRQTQP